ncbi:hypothetical protein ABFY60_09055 [Lysinibacillus pakistanensis]|uniref:hypothetical protein n=1 Tax=Lysinibacillus pakistanensis TaxID=759811 RepID=UPI003D2C5C29
MDTDLKELLRSVLREELAPINQRLDGMDKRFDGIEQRLDKIESDVQELKAGQAELQKNIVGNLGNFTEKIAHQVEDRTGALNKRVFEVETVIQRLTNQ